MKRLALALTLAAPTATWAADAPRAELFAGYSHARHDTQETDGFTAGLGLPLRGALGLELTLARQYDSELGTSLSWTSVAAGPRLTWWRDSVSPFVALQGGLERRTTRISVFDADVSQTETKALAQAMAGVEIAVGSRWAVRAHGVAAFRDAFPGEGDQDDGLRWDPQAALSVVYRFGRR